MTEEPDIAADEPMLQLLTDALRAGPASPEWAAAVAQLPSSDILDERSALLATREKLESGKAYREVRAGPGFARKLFTKVADDTPTGSKPKSPLGISLLSYLGACAIVGTAAMLAFILLNSATSGGENLSTLFFRTTVASTKLDGPLSSGWRKIGPLGVDTAKGLAVTGGAATTDYHGGGVVTASPISSAEPFAVEVTLQFDKVSDAVVPQVFVTDKASFEGDTASSPRELVWLVRGGVSQVASPDGSLTVSNQKIADNSTVSVRMVVGVTDAQVSSDNRAIWSGQSKLTGEGRYIGVRILRRGKAEGNVVVKSIKVLEK